jgi:tetratricopeptide (TPR) repeat protein
MPSKPRRTARKTSGAVGGPATGRGMNYQVYYGLCQTLDLIAIALIAPHQAAAIWVEPRVITGEDVTTWDFGATPPGSLTEAKVSPTREEIVDWVHRAAKKAADGHATLFRLVYSRGGGPTLEALMQLVRIAKEAQGKQDDFQKLIGHENAKRATELLKSLGSAPAALLKMLSAEHIPEATLEENITFRARCLSGTDADRLRQLLFEKLSLAIIRRASLSIRAIIDDIARAGIRLQPPPCPPPGDLAPEAYATLITLQHCPTPVPTQVLADSQMSALDNFERALKPLTENGVVIAECGLFSLAPSPVSFRDENVPAILSKSLRALLDFIRKNGRTQVSRSQVQNAVSLARACAQKEPAAVANAFRCLDKNLKDLGDKHLVLGVAELSVAAARNATPKTIEETKGEAHALICGISWVYQRVGRLREAETAAEKSLSIGENIQWGRNSAYCKKCIGRLFRLQAEAARDPTMKAQLIDKSTRSLAEAIEMFSNLPKFGPEHEEIGDCHSLRGRSHLVAGRLQEAEDAIHRAYKLIHNQDSKEYLDLLILDGDVQSERGSRVAAEHCYCAALATGHDDTPELSEIRARAHFHRGTNRSRLGRSNDALEDFREARRVWERLGEQDAAAEAEWAEIVQLHLAPPTLLKRLKAEGDARARAKAVRIYEQEVGSARRGVARRSDPGMKYWDHLLRKRGSRWRSREKNGEPRPFQNT